MSADGINKSETEHVRELDISQAFRDLKISWLNCHSHSLEKY